MSVHHGKNGGSSTGEDVPDQLTVLCSAQLFKHYIVFDLGPISLSLLRKAGSNVPTLDLNEPKKKNLA